MVPVNTLDWTTRRGPTLVGIRAFRRFLAGGVFRPRQAACPEAKIRGVLRGVPDAPSSGGRDRGVMPNTTTLARSRTDRVIAGVCAGLAERIGWRPTTMRLLFVVSCLLPGPQFLVYLVLWVIMPKAPR